MKKVLDKLGYIFPSKYKLGSVLFFLCISPVLNYTMINIYYYNCGGYIDGYYDLLNLINPFNIQNPLCILLSTLITSNIYIVQYINYIILLYIIGLILH